MNMIDLKCGRHQTPNSCRDGANTVISKSNCLLKLRSDKVQNVLGAADESSILFPDLVGDDGVRNDVDGDSPSLPFPGVADLLERIRDCTALCPVPGAE